MDLHVIGPLASPAERSAVDAVLGPAESAWRGGNRSPLTEGHVARGGHAVRSRRDLLLPAFHAVQSRIGWISQPALNYVCRRLSVPPAEAYGVATFYALFATKPRPPIVAHVCDDIACRLAGAGELMSDLERAVGPAGEPDAPGMTTWLRSPCLGLCERAPAAMFTVAGAEPTTQVAAPVDAVGISARLADATNGISDAGATSEPGRSEAARSAAPQAGEPGLRLLARVGVVDPTSLDDYRASGGFRALDRARAIGPQAVIEEVTRSGLVGRGGAAFPTGRKWAAVAAQAGQPHYFVCNADESEPGTFKDRVLMEHDPFAVIEAMAIEAFAVGAQKAYIYIRGEYPLAEARNRRCHRRHTRVGSPRRAGHRGQARCRRVYLRRGDGALRVDRGQSRRAPQQAAVPGRGRPVRQADGDQQRRDARQRPAHRR